METINWQNIKDKITPHMVPELFDAPLFVEELDNYFPAMLERKLNSWIAIYKTKIQAIIDTLDIPINREVKNFTLTQIESLSNGILLAVDLYYKGKVLDATVAFNECISSMMWNQVFQSLYTINTSTALYRARVTEEKRMSRQDLFHIPFEKRHLVSTKRYSIPGFPALYLADNTYTCWEEFNRCRLKDLWFSRFQPTDTLNIIYIERVEDFLKSLDKIDVKHYSTHVIIYLTMFPLQIACTQKVLIHDAPFKPEYIIPQLLLQYVKQDANVDGIKFPSSKIDYNSIYDLQSYNYVFPVKNCQKKWYCPELAGSFHLTEPTNLELEEILYNPAYPITYLHSPSSSTQRIELVKNVKSLYIDTAFGKIEDILKKRPVNNVYTDSNINPGY